MKKILIIAFVLNFIIAPSVFADTLAPSAITNLSVSNTSTSTVSLSWTAPAEDGTTTQPEYVIIISVDGMGSEYIRPLLATTTNQLTTTNRFINEGVGTLNARDDADYAITLPNHITMITGRSVTGTDGHNWTSNGDPAPTDTLATNKGSYVASIFDVAHDNGLRTGLWSGKSKFSIFQQSYSDTTGAVDTTGVDNGRDKIDYNYIVSSVAANTLTTDFINQMAADPFEVAFIHYQDPDATGHSSGWSTATSSSFAGTLKAVDTEIGRILTMIENSDVLRGKTAVILTADHGGHSTTHGDITNYLDYTIPFYVWGANVSSGEDLYDLNSSSRTEPNAAANPSYSVAEQPIRDGDVSNLALDLLELNAIPGSIIDDAQDLVTQNSGTASAYDLRYGTSTITEGNWSEKNQASSEPTPATVGTTQTFTIPSLSENTLYYFALKTSDDASNVSALSNVTSTTTLETITPTPEPVVTPTPSRRRSSGGGNGSKPKTVVIATSTIQQTAPTNQKPTSPSRIPNTFYFSRELATGSNGLDVQYLQTFLNDRGFTITTLGAGALGHETTFFGAGTRAALARYQQTKMIVPATGDFDLRTRLFVLVDVLTQRLNLLLGTASQI